MFINRSIKFLLTVLALALLPVGSAAAAGPSGAVVFSRAIVTAEKTRKRHGRKSRRRPLRGQGGRLNQLTENPADSEPDFSADGRKIAFVRGGDVWAMRADGSGQRQLTAGPEVD